MASYTTLVCDICGDEQRSGSNIYWAAKHRDISLKCPVDGLNGSKWDIVACEPCRRALDAAIRGVMDSRGKGRTDG